MNIDIPKKLADNLQTIANQQNSSLETVLVQLLMEYQGRADERAGSFAVPAKSAFSNGLLVHKP